LHIVRNDGGLALGLGGFRPVEELTWLASLLQQALAAARSESAVPASAASAPKA
jgi:hypothetical protein